MQVKNFRMCSSQRQKYTELDWPPSSDLQNLLTPTISEIT